MNPEPSQPQIRDMDAAVCGYRLRVRWIGDPAAGSSARPVLVFLHEGLGCIDMWRDFPRQISVMTGCSAFIYDRPGYGKSDPIISGSVDVDYLHRESFEVLPALLQRFHIGRCVLIGHSDGATIALYYSAAYPEQVAAVIAEAAHVLIEDVTLEGIRQAVSSYTSSDLRHRLQAYHGDNLDPVFRRWANTWLAANPTVCDLQAYLPRITSPVLVIQGIDDEYGTEKQVEAISHHVGGYSETLLIPGCGHVPHHQARRVVIRNINRFLTDQVLMTDGLKAE